MKRLFFPTYIAYNFYNIYNLTMPANYDNSAWFYDRLSRLVYGDVLMRAQVYLLQFIPANAKLLLVGGGTGWILEDLGRVRPSGLKIVYVEVSSKMIAKAQKKDTGGNEVIFINSAVENTTLAAGFDVVMTPFLFDSFSDQTVDKVFGHIHTLLKPGGLWLYADFRPAKKWWQHFLLTSMLAFFRAICNIESMRLPDVDSRFKRHGYEIFAQQSFFRDFLTSVAYRKHNMQALPL